MARHRRKRRKQGVVSGADWVNQFPTSTSVEDLASPFRDNVSAFLSVLQKAGAVVEISATYRPAERAYLMHYAYRIAREGLDPRDVPSRSNVDIDWVHRNSSGRYDETASRNAAEAMVHAFGIVYRPALNSQHTRRLAIDMTISWDGTLNISDADGKQVKIASAPRSGQNRELVKVGASYEVIKLVSDPPHWSVDGT